MQWGCRPRNCIGNTPRVAQEGDWAARAGGGMVVWEMEEVVEERVGLGTAVEQGEGASEGWD